VQNPQRCAAPTGEGLLQALGEGIGTKNSAIQQQRVGNRHLRRSPVSPSAWRAAAACRRRKAATWRVIAGSAG
jgi:hypothetical protein